MATHFADRLNAAVVAKRSAVVVGIDPRPDRFPSAFAVSECTDRAAITAQIDAFGSELIRIVAPKVPAVKFQLAFYEAFGSEGLRALWKNVDEAKRAGLVVILDGKRNDIGSTAEAYAQGYLGRLARGRSAGPVAEADAMTVNPYLGSDGVLPFSKVAGEQGKGLFVLVRTSNPSSAEFQELVAEGKPVYRHVADQVARWAEPLRGESGYSAIGAVIGATYPDQLLELRQAIPGVFFLVPGYGAQGGHAETVASAFDEQGLGALINSSRDLIFAHQRPEIQREVGDDWHAAVSLAVDLMNAELRDRTAMGQL